MNLHSQIIHQNKNVNDNTNIDNCEEETKNIEEAVSSEDEDKEETDDEDEINIDYEHIVDDESGAESYKGTKPCFVETVKAVKQRLQEKVGGYIKKINNHNMVVRDVRYVDYGVEADIEISKGRLRGVAKLKIWGPSKSPKGKNKCHITAARFPKADKKYATILSKKIIKPLIDSYLKGDGWNTIMSSKPITRNERVQCTECDKFVSKLYLNTHSTKMHP